MLVRFSFMFKGFIQENENHMVSLAWKFVGRYTTLTSWKEVLFEQITEPHLATQFPHFMKSICSLPFLQQPDCTVS